MILQTYICDRCPRRDSCYGTEAVARKCMMDGGWRLFDGAEAICPNCNLQLALNGCDPIRKPTGEIVR